MNRLIITVSICTLLVACKEHTARKHGFGVHGIDVSHYQKEIDWEKISQQGIHFAFIKATEGETFKDSLFCKNWGEIKKAGIKRGAYHFFRPRVPAEKQAVNFLTWIDMEVGDLAPVLDVEVTDNVTPDSLIIGVRVWLSLVERALGIKPIIYTNQKFFNQYLAGHFMNYPVWIARYSYWRYPAMMTDQNWTFWQYGCKGKLEGIAGYVDFNVFKGEEKDLERFSLSQSSASSSFAAPLNCLVSAGP